jgi:hypothetical protein
MARSTVVLLGLAGLVGACSPRQSPPPPVTHKDAGDPNDCNFTGCPTGWKCVVGTCVTTKDAGLVHDAGVPDSGVDDGGALDAGDDGGTAGPDGGDPDGSAGAGDGGPDAGPAPDGGTVGMPTSPGQIVISELLIDAPGTGEPGEYFEVYNATGGPLDLQGCLIESQKGTSTETHPIASACGVAPLGYAAISSSGVVAETGFTPTYVYGSITFSNSTADWLALRCNGTVIDGIGWKGNTVFPNLLNVFANIAWERSTASLSNGAATAATGWCQATNNIAVSIGGSPTSYTGTPGQANNCP